MKTEMLNPEALEFTLNGIDYAAVDSKPKGKEHCGTADSVA